MRLIIVLIMAETLFYLLLRGYLRSRRTERLEDIWDARHPDQAGNDPARREFVRKALVGFEKTLKVRLLVLVFIIPTLAVMGIVYLVNWQ